MDSKTETVSDNELIAVFDGWTKNPEINKGSRIQWTHPKYSTKLTDTLSIPTTPENMKYQTSWDWLMPVVERFFEVCQSVEDKVMANLVRGVIERSIWDALYKRGTIADVTKTLADKIKWFNSQPQQP